ncbi:MAG: hypothetical protein LC791_07265 [Acidobacteria bacterium]|nr:hypothetical protein [Acidobacteriota bacterium]
MSGARLGGVTLFAFATLIIGYALQLNNGLYGRSALALLIVAIGSAGAALAGPRWLVSQRSALSAPGWLTVVMLVGLAADLTILSRMPPGLYLRRPSPSAHPFLLGALAAAALVVGLVAADRARARRLWFPALLLTAGALGLWMIDASPKPWIDVMTVHRVALGALRAGENPYAVTFPNIYRDEAFYGPDMVANDQVMFGLPYPPLSLLMALPGELLFGDIRYAELGALLVGAALIGYAAPTRDERSIVGPLAAALLLFTPRGLFVLEQGWTEAFAVCWLGATVFAACRAPRALPWMLALLVSVKQHMLLAAPLALLLLPRPLRWRDVRRLLTPSVVVPLLLALPFLIWNAGAFLRSVVWLQWREPFRRDALSVLSALADAGWSLERDSVVTLIAPLVALAGGGFVTWRWAPRSPVGFAAGLGFTLLLLFAGSKKAFCNYYYFVMACFCAAIAVSGHASRPKDSHEGHEP